MKTKRFPAIFVIVTILVSAFAINVFAADEGQTGFEETYNNDADGILIPQAKIGDTTYETIADAIASAEDGDVVELLSNVTLSETIVLENANITITGKKNETENYTISGEEIITKNEKGGIVGIKVSGGDVTIENINLINFDAIDDCNAGSVIEIDDDAKFTAVNLSIKYFARDAFSFYHGNFIVDGCNIDCNVREGRGVALTKGFQIGAATKGTPVTGVIKNTQITNSSSNYEKWTAGAIELYAGAKVEVDNCEISNSTYGIYIDNYWGGMYDNY